MTRIVWDQFSTRTFQAGVDQCVIYPSGKTGVAWNGVTKIQESISGADSESNFLDGRKYRVRANNSSFSLKLSAFSAPEEFYHCLGTVEIRKGLLATEQPKETFGFSYRTLIGSDRFGLDYEYKIHILYNVVATPMDVDYNTTGKAAEPTVRQWRFDTIPYFHNEYSYFRSGRDQVEIQHQDNIYEPTSRIIVDTRSVGPAAVELLEKVLYGTENTEAEFPTPVEILELIR